MGGETLEDLQSRGDVVGIEEGGQRLSKLDVAALSPAKEKTNG